MLLRQQDEARCPLILASQKARRDPWDKPFRLSSAYPLLVEYCCIRVSEDDTEGWDDLPVRPMSRTGPSFKTLLL